MLLILIFSLELHHIEGIVRINKVPETHPKSTVVESNS